MSGWAEVAKGALDVVNGGLSLWGQSKAARRQWAQQKEALQNQNTQKSERPYSEQTGSPELPKNLQTGPDGAASGDRQENR